MMTNNDRFAPSARGRTGFRRPAFILTSQLLVAGLLLGLTACKTTRQVKIDLEDNKSGFLGDYSMLQRGADGEASYVYFDHSTDWSKYKKIWIKPIELWGSEDTNSPINDLSDESKQTLVDCAYSGLYEALTNSFEIVDHGGPDVLIIHGAITDAKKSKPIINFVSSVYLPLKVVSFGKRLITGTDIGVGKVVVEAEFLDGESNKRIAAAMDARAGTKALRTKFNSTWGDVKLAFEWWGERLDKRLLALQKGDYSTESF
jgi:hypothetical protein